VAGQTDGGRKSGLVTKVSHRPPATPTAVQRLLDAGASMVGKDDAAEEIRLRPDSGIMH